MSRISRRSLLTTGAAAGVLAASGMAVSAAAPRSGGLLRAGLSGGSCCDTWDSRRHASLFMMAACHGAVFDCLTEIGPDGALRGELAQSWDANTDGRIWTFALRKEVTFHNGKPFVAEDVLESFALHRGSKAYSPAEPLLRDVVDVRALGPHQVEFELASPNADFPYLLADYHFVIYPAGYIELAMQNGIGTGIYRVAEFRPGHSLSATRIKAHYKEGKAGFFDELQLFNLSDASERLNALLEGRVDVASQLTPAQAMQLRDMRGVSLQVLQGNQHIGFALGENIAARDVQAVRQAVKLAVDRTGFVDDALLGFGEIGADAPVGPANPFYLAAEERVAFDPDKARYLLQSAGVDRLKVHVHSEAQGHPKAMRAFSRDMSAVGLSIVLEKGNAQVDVSASAGRATEDWALSTYLAPNAAWNHSGWKDCRFSSILAAARSELNAEKRKVHYHDLQILAQELGGLVVPAFMKHLQATDSSVSTPPKVGAHYAMDNARFAERWWRG